MNAIFPREGTERHAYIITSTRGDLPSAVHDAYTHSILWSRRGFQLHHFLDVVPQQLNTLQRWLEPEQLRVTPETNLDMLPVVLRGYATTEVPTDLVITLSTHGYLDATRNPYFMYQGRRYSDRMVATWLTPLQHNPQLRVLVLVDMCNAGNLWRLPASGTTLPDTTPVIAISATQLGQSDPDDISDEFGFGGGLTTCVADYLGSGNGSFEIPLLYEFCRQRLRRAHVDSVAYWV